MNFLAHLFLSPVDEDITFGNFIADSVKGKAFYAYNEAVQKGILYHRFIDQYTDTHEQVRLSKERLSAKFGKFSGVIVDIYYDHFLAANWHVYSNSSLNEFAQRHYQTIESRFEQLPQKSKRIFPYMRSQDWLSNYSDLAFLQKVFEGMAKRTSFESQMEQATPYLLMHYKAFAYDFRQFFPQLTLASSQYISDTAKVLLRTDMLAAIDLQ